MPTSVREQRGQDGFLDRAALRAGQAEKLVRLLDTVATGNAFYKAKYAAAGVDPRGVRSVEDLVRLPFTTKAELASDQESHPPYGTALTYPLTRYTRMHQTSGTTLGRPLRWLDTPESWDWLLDCWATNYRVCGLEAGDRLFFAFSFGPFLGFWTAFEAAAREGMLALPGGGISTSARLQFVLNHRPTAVLCTPTYALHMAEAAARESIDLRATGVRMLIVAGEPGGSIPATRARIEGAFGARVFDHNGLTEVGVLGIECPENPAGLHVLESEYIAEVIQPATGRPADAGQVGELVVTNLGRLGSPVIRYRTGDLVRVDAMPCPCGRSFIRLAGGVLGRVDDMVQVRGNNVYPSAIEAIVRRHAGVAEYRVVVDQTEPLSRMRIEIEPAAGADGAALAETVGRQVRDELLFRAEVAAVAAGTLPRYEMKARRLIIRRAADGLPGAGAEH